MVQEILKRNSKRNLRLLLALATLLMCADVVAQEKELRLFRDISGKYGYANSKGEIVIEPVFIEAEPFYDGVARVVDDDWQAGVIDEKGVFVMKPWGKYQDYVDGRFIVEGLSNKNEAQRYEILPGFYGFELVKYPGFVTVPNNKLMSKSNPGYDALFHLGKGLLAVKVENPKKRDSKWGLMWANGKTVSRAVYDKIGCSYYFDRDSHVNHHYQMKGFTNGLCPVEKGSRYGFIDTTGKVAIGLKYFGVTHFSEGLAAAGETKKGWGYINTKGEWVIEPKYDQAGIFSEGLAGVSIDKNGYYIDKRGEVVFTINMADEKYFKYDPCKDDGEKLSSIKRLGAFENGLAPLWGKKFSPCTWASFWDGYYRICNIDKKGRDYDLESFYIVELNLVAVKSDDLWGLIDTEGNDIIVPFSTEQPKYDVRTGLVRFADQYYDRCGELVENAPSYANVKASIIWENAPDSTICNPLLLNAVLESKNEIEYYKLMVNNVEVNKVECKKEKVRSYREKDIKQEVNYNLFLEEGLNSVEIEVKNTAGTVRKDWNVYLYDEKYVQNMAEPKLKFKMNGITTGQSMPTVEPILSEPEPAKIEWAPIPSKTEKQQLNVNAVIISDSKIEYYRVLRNEEELINSTYPVKSRGEENTKGAIVPGGAYNEDNGTFRFSISNSIPLFEGDNRITIEVKNAADKVSRKEQRIYYQHVEKRLALVIGNNEYQSLPPLTNPVNDARAIRHLLETSGYDVMPVAENLDEIQMRKAIRDFIEKIEKENYEVALFYFSGHGISLSSNNNYIIPVKDDIHCVTEAKTRGVDVQSVLMKQMSDLKNCQVRIALLDCCRNCELKETCDDNNTSKGVDNSGGMRLLTYEGVSVFYAAQDGKTAVEGSKGGNSPFVEGILKCAKEDYNWPTFVVKVRDEVVKATNKKQKPERVGDFVDEAEFKPFKKK